MDQNESEGHPIWEIDLKMQERRTDRVFFRGSETNHRREHFHPAVSSSNGGLSDKRNKHYISQSTPLVWKLSTMRILFANGGLGSDSLNCNISAWLFKRSVCCITKCQICVLNMWSPNTCFHYIILYFINLFILYSFSFFINFLLSYSTINKINKSSLHLFYSFSPPCLLILVSCHLMLSLRQFISLNVKVTAEKVKLFLHATVSLNRLSSTHTLLKSEYYCSCIITWCML